MRMTIMFTRHARNRAGNCSRTFFAVLCLLAASSLASAQEEAVRRPDRVVPTKPFQIIGNVYYVGQTNNAIPGSDDASFLITTRDGHILLDTSEEEMLPQLRANIEKLGFKLADIKYLIHSHSHSDHVAGDADFKKMVPGLKLVASALDAEVIESGGKADFDTSRAQFKPAKVDRIIKDGEKLELGGVSMVARVTAGHTKGCTTWTTVVEDAGRKLNAVFVCSARISEGMNLVNNPRYPAIAADFRKTFATLKELPVDVFFASHAFFFNMVGKAKMLESKPKQNPFIDPQGFKDFVTLNEKNFLTEYQKQGGK